MYYAQAGKNPRQKARRMMAGEVNRVCLEFRYELHGE